MAMIKNDKEALTHALILGITAPTEKLQEVMEIAQVIADKLSDEEVEQCKQEAIAWIDEQEMKKRDEDNEVIH
jgi:hypothetical protein